MITKTHTHTTSSVVIHHTSSYAHGISQSRSIRAVARRRARVNPPKRFCRCTYTPIRRINHPRCFIRINLRAFLPIRRHRSPHARARQRPSRAQRRRSPQPCGESDGIIARRAIVRIASYASSTRARCDVGTRGIYIPISSNANATRAGVRAKTVSRSRRALTRTRARDDPRRAVGRSVDGGSMQRWRSIAFAIARKHSSAFAIAMCIDRSIDRSCGWGFLLGRGGAGRGRDW